MRYILSPGETIIISGQRGGGKTATAVSVVQRAIAGKYGHKRVYCVTNVIFGRTVGHGAPPIEDYPPNVFYADTLADTMRRIGQILATEGTDVLIIWLLDEAQNYMIADQNASKENQALIKYLGNARKFRCCNIFLTPAVNNLAPRVRNFPNGESKAGYCSCRIRKNIRDAREKTKDDPRSVAFIQTAADELETPIVIKPSGWVTGLSSTEAGAYGYDTLSTAMFTVGANRDGVQFSFEDFIKSTSGGMSHEVPQRIARYFEEWDSAKDDAHGDEAALPGEDFTRIRIADQMRRIDRMQSVSLTTRQYRAIVKPIVAQLVPAGELRRVWASIDWGDNPKIALTLEQVGQIEGEPARTIQSRRRVWNKSDEIETSDAHAQYIQPEAELEAGAAGARQSEEVLQDDNQNEEDEEKHENKALFYTSPQGGTCTEANRRSEEEHETDGEV